MSECGYCNKSLRSEDVKQVILCTGQCDKAFHIRCTELNDTKTTRQTHQKKQKTWRKQESGIMKILTEINTKVSKIDTMESKLDHYEKMINETTTKMDVMSKLLNELKEEQKEVKKPILK